MAVSHVGIIFCIVSMRIYQPGTGYGQCPKNMGIYILWVWVSIALQPVQGISYLRPQSMPAIITRE